MSSSFISFLIEKGKVQKTDGERILSVKEPSEYVSVEEQLVSSGLLTEEEVRSNLEEYLVGTPFAVKEDFPQEAVLINHLSVQFMKESTFIPARLIKNELTVIMNNPLDFYTIDAIRLATGYDVQVLYGKEETITWAIEQYYGSGTTSMEKIIEDMESIPEYQTADEENIDHLRDMAPALHHCQGNPDNI